MSSLSGPISKQAAGAQTVQSQCSWVIDEQLYPTCTPSRCLPRPQGTVSAHGMCPRERTETWPAGVSWSPTLPCSRSATGVSPGWTIAHVKGSPWGLEDPGRVTAINAGTPDLRTGGVNRTEESCRSCAISWGLDCGGPHRRMCPYIRSSHGAPT